jgi:mono/diheme cytochrome c family protein
MIWFARSAALACAVAAGAVAAAQTVAVEEWDAPPEARALANPLNPTNPEHLKKGRGLFVRHCVTCHGEQGRGDGPSARLHARRSGYQPRDLSRSDVQTGLTDGEIFWKIGAGWRPKGRIVMPGVGNEVSEGDRWTLVLYVRSLGQKGGGP